MGDPLMKLESERARQHESEAALRQIVLDDVESLRDYLHEVVRRVHGYHHMIESGEGRALSHALAISDHIFDLHRLCPIGNMLRHALEYDEECAR